jgi:hypothetical protein
MNTTGKHRAPRRTGIRANSLHIPIAAAAWRAPELIYASVFAGVIGVGVLSGIAFVGMVGSFTPIFNKNARLGWEYYQSCIAQTELENPRVATRLIQRSCENRRVLFEARLNR